MKHTIEFTISDVNSERFGESYITQKIKDETARAITEKLIPELKIQKTVLGRHEHYKASFYILTEEEMLKIEAELDMLRNLVKPSFRQEHSFEFEVNPQEVAMFAELMWKLRLSAMLPRGVP